MLILCFYHAKNFKKHQRLPLARIKIMRASCCFCTTAQKHGPKCIMQILILKNVWVELIFFFYPMKVVRNWRGLRKFIAKIAVCRFGNKRIDTFCISIDSS